MRLIDADKLRERMYHDAFETDTDMQKWDSGCWIRYKMFENAMDSVPIVDAVEVVRCKDCKWVRKAGTLMGENPEPIYGCHHTGVYVFEDGYCDVGERKDE